MKNQEIANIFDEMGDILEMLEVQWKPQAFHKGARSLRTLQGDVEEIAEKGGVAQLKKIPGIGERLAEKIIEYCETGKIKEYGQLLKRIPKGVQEMMHIPGLGPKRAWTLHKKLKIKSAKQLEQAAKKGKIQRLEGFGKKSEQDILEGLALLKGSKGRVPLGEAYPLAQEIKEKLSKLRQVGNIEIAGSLRRMRESVKDIDILITSDKPLAVMDAFKKLENIKKVIATGKTKTSVILKEGINVDLRVVDEKSFGSALQYFTGSKDHNIRLRQIAIRKGYKLSEYGLFKGARQVAGKDEKSIYKKLGLPLPPPELRENNLEFKGKLPTLIGYEDLKGSLHNHSTWSDGQNSIEEMIKEAIKQGHAYYAQTDHSKSATIANGLEMKRLSSYLKEVAQLKKKYSRKIHVLSGAEVDILKGGKLDYPDKTLERFDIVVASVHSSFKQSKKEMTQRVLAALSNKHVTILGHPTGRLIGRRKPFEIDMEKVLQAAKDNGVAVEINCAPRRLDLNDSHIRLALDMKCKLCINADAHSASHFSFLRYGIGQARRAGAQKKDIINTKPWNALKKHLGL